MCRIRVFALLLTCVAGVGCGAAAPIPAMSPGAAKVEVKKASAPHGAKELGVIDVSHGNGCGGFGRKGSLEGALVLLREEAYRRGATYVELLAVTEPHSEYKCFDQTFKVRGMAYKLGAEPDEPAEKPKEKPQSPPRVATCDPPCSPGYACAEGKCAAVCNPACDSGQICRQDRTCGPASAAEPAK